MSLQTELAAREREARAQVLLLQSMQRAQEEEWCSEPAQVKIYRPLTVSQAMSRLMHQHALTGCLAWSWCPLENLLGHDLPTSTRKPAAAEGYCFTCVQSAHILLRRP